MEQLVPENVNAAHDHIKSTLIVGMLEISIVPLPFRNLLRNRSINTIRPVPLNEEGIIQKSAQIFGSQFLDKVFLENAMRF